MQLTTDRAGAKKRAPSPENPPESQTFATLAVAAERGGGVGIKTSCLLYLATKKGAPGVGSKAKNNGSNNKHSQRLAGQVQADRNERPKGFRRAKGQKKSVESEGGEKGQAKTVLARENSICTRQKMVQQILGK